MHITIKYKNLDATPAIDAYVREKFGSISKLFSQLDKGGAVEADFRISRTTKHHKKGPVFSAECVLDLPGKVLRAEYADWNIRRAVDEIKNELQQEIKKYTNKMRAQDSGAQKKLRQLRGKE